MVAAQDISLSSVITENFWPPVSATKHAWAIKGTDFSDVLV
jgi:hypothetical protein